MACDGAYRAFPEEKPDSQQSSPFPDDTLLLPVNRNEEFVEVPNTEFVALIVGRNGHKIKSIRERTGTFIKTPLRNEPPVFKIAGAVQNVARAKQEIMEIVQRLKSPQYRYGGLLTGDGHSPESRITIDVRVPFKFVGLVVGFQGSTVMDIQHQTKTHIQTPAHGGEPIFQVTGGPKNVFMAKLLINAHIENRTGLNILEVDSLLEEPIDQHWKELLAKYGVAATLHAIKATQLQQREEPEPLRFPENDLMLRQVPLSPAAAETVLLTPPPFCGPPPPFLAPQERSVAVPAPPMIDIHKTADWMFFGGEPVTPPAEWTAPVAVPPPPAHGNIGEPELFQMMQMLSLHPISDCFPEPQPPEEGAAGGSAFEHSRNPTQSAARDDAYFVDSSFWENLALINNFPAEQVL